MAKDECECLCICGPALDQSDLTINDRICGWHQLPQEN